MCHAAATIGDVKLIGFTSSLDLARGRQRFWQRSLRIVRVPLNDGIVRQCAVGGPSTVGERFLSVGRACSTWNLLSGAAGDYLLSCSLALMAERTMRTPSQSSICPRRRSC